MARIQFWSFIVVAAMLLGGCLFRPAMIHIGDLLARKPGYR